MTVKLNDIQLCEIGLNKKLVQNQRDIALKMVTCESSSVAMFHNDYIPLIIDMFEGFKITMEPCMKSVTKITVYK